MSLDYAVDITHAAIAHPHVTLIKNFSQRVTLIEVLLHQVYKFACNVSFD